MSQPKSLLFSIVTTKCPRCREGKMFSSGTLYTTKFSDMNHNCSCCGQDFEQEPGYYFGAMYVSFAINVGIFLVTLFILSQLVKEVTMAMMIGVITTVVIGLLPIIFRLSRALWINIFIHYQGNCQQILESRRHKQK